MNRKSDLNNTSSIYLSKESEQMNRKPLLFGTHLLIAFMIAAMTVAVEPAGAENNAGPFSLDVGLDITTQYFFRGILQEDAGLIAQPWGELGISLYTGGEGDTINSVGATIGWWNSLHEEQTGTDDDGPAIWYETDLYAGVSVDFYEKWLVGVAYTLYNSPNSAFDDVQELQINLGFDDSACWEAAGVDIPGFSGFRPNVTVAFETKNAADGADEGIYIELALEPSFTPMPNSGLEKLTLSVPITLGFSADEYYQSPSNGDDETFGFLEVGVNLSWPLADNIDLSAGPYFLFLGSTAEDFNDGDDESFELIGKLGISISF